MLQTRIIHHMMVCAFLPQGDDPNLSHSQFNSIVFQIESSNPNQKMFSFFTGSSKQTQQQPAQSNHNNNSNTSSTSRQAHPNSNASSKPLPSVPPQNQQEQALFSQQQQQQRNSYQSALVYLTAEQHDILRRLLMYSTLASMMTEKDENTIAELVKQFGSDTKSMKLLMDCLLDTVCSFKSNTIVSHKQIDDDIMDGQP